MADEPPAPTDRDLASLQEARALSRRAAEARPVLAEFSQAQIDALIDAMAAAVTPQAEALARLAVEETGYGVVADKVEKNLFASDRVYRFIRPMKTVGVIRRDESRRIVEIAEPFGVVAAVVPSTNPTSTTIYKALIAIKARCPIVISPHPGAVRSISRTAEILLAAAREAGAPEGAISWMTTVSIEGTQALMASRDVAVILATGGMGLVRAAYSAGKPAYGVGPGNAPAYIERTADVRKAVHDIIRGKTFDNGVLCSSENSVVVDEAIAAQVRGEFVANHAHFLSPAGIEAVGKALVTPQRLPDPALVGKPATFVAERAGVRVPPETRVLIAELAGVGREYPLSIEKLCPVLSFYVVKDWQEGCERCKQILRYGGMGHTMAIHSRNESIILEFGLKKPAFRIVVNTPTTHGSLGMTTGLDPAMTLGCGGYGGNITSDNISPMHLLNIKRLAYDLTPVLPTPEARVPLATGVGQATAATAPPRLPVGPSAPPPAGIEAESLVRQIDEFVKTRGAAADSRGSISQPDLPPAPTPVDFVCEDDVRRALGEGRRIVVGDRTIITPAARDLGEARGVFIHMAWRTP